MFCNTAYLDASYVFLNTFSKHHSPVGLYDDYGPCSLWRRK